MIKDSVTHATRRAVAAWLAVACVAACRREGAAPWTGGEDSSTPADDLPAGTPHIVEVGDGDLGPTITGLQRDSSLALFGVAGDLDGDGREELLVHGDDQLYVVFGTDAPGPIDLADIAAGTGGFAVPFSWEFGYGYSGGVVGPGDLDGDGFDDLIVEKDSPENTVILLGGAGAERRALWRTLDPSVTAAYEGYRGPRCGVGDVTGDGHPDWLAAYYGSADLFHGGPMLTAGAVVAEKDLHVTSFVDVEILRCTGVGDVNGDGFGDFAVRAYRHDAEGPHNDDPDFDRGRVYVVFGGDDLPPTTIEADLAAGIGGFLIRGAGAYDDLGASIAAAGDVDRDGRADFLLGAPEHGARAGAFYLIHGRTETTPIELATTLIGVTRFSAPDITERLGLAVAGSVSADEVMLIAGSPCGLMRVDGCRDRVYVTDLFDAAAVDLAASVADGTTRVLEGGWNAALAEEDWAELARFGSNLASLDFDGDGATDLAIAATTEDWNGPNSGRVYLVLAARLGGPA